MPYQTEEIKKGIKIHYIETNKFKTNLIAVFLSIPIKRETVTSNALIPEILKMGNKEQKTQDEISIMLENIYGANFNYGIEKIGDNHVLKFYIEVLNEKFIIDNEKILEESINLLLNIIFNPLLENNKFKETYINIEKNNLEEVIKAKIDDKGKYAFNRCVEEMYKDQPYGLYKYGYIEDLNKINSESLYKDYIKLINEAKIDIFVSGDIKKEEIKEILNKNKNIKNLNCRGRRPRRTAKFRQGCLCRPAKPYKRY